MYSRFFGPVFTSSESMRGGAAVLKAQSACAFQAFAKYRLDLRGPEHACFGLDASARGILLHSVLEIVWREWEASSVCVNYLRKICICWSKLRLIKR